MIYTLTLNTALDCLITKEDYEKENRLTQEVPAGKGINVSRALASKGLASVCLGLVGIKDKESFDTISHPLIESKFIYVAGDTRRNLTITGYNDGIERHERNEGFAVSEDDLKAICKLLDEKLLKGDYLIMSGSLPKGAPLDTYYKLIKHFRAKGVFTILDTSGPALKEAVKAGPYAIKPNLEELLSLWDEKFVFQTEDEEISMASSELNSLNPAKENDRKLITDLIASISRHYSINYILATFDLNGATLYSLEDAKAISLPIYSKESNKPFVSSVGCGDCSLAGFIYGLVKNKSLEECAECSMVFAFENLYAQTPGALSLEI